MPQTALLIIDMQVGLADEACEEDKAILTCIADLLSKAREEHVPIIFIQHDGGPGHPLEPGTLHDYLPFHNAP